MTDRRRAERSRRMVLRALGGAAVLGLAGCSGLRGGGTGSGPQTDDDATASADRTPPRDGTTESTTDRPRPTATPRDPRSVDPAGAWGQAGSDPSRDGGADAAGVPDDGTPYWRLRRIRSGPAVLADDRLYHLAKLGENEDQPVTVTRTRSEPSTAHPVYGRPHLVARDASDGRIEWSRELPVAPNVWPATDGDRVVTAVDGQVVCVDAAHGDVVWRDEHDKHRAGEPAIVGDDVIVPLHGTVDGETGDYVKRPAIRCYALADGAERWSVEPPRRGNAVAVADGVAFALSWSWDEKGELLALDLTDGSERWRTATPGSFFASPIVADGTVLLSNADGRLVALDAADGTEIWSQTIDALSPVAATDGDAVYAGASGTLVALGLDDGAEQWMAPLSDESDGVYAVATGSDTLYVAATGSGPGLFAVDAADGGQRWAHRFPDQVVEGDVISSGVRSQPVVGDDALFVNAVDGLYAFGPDG